MRKENVGERNIGERMRMRGKNRGMDKGEKKD